VILCIEQAGTLHVVYEIQEPANGGIGALTEVELSQARIHARKLTEAGLLEPDTFTIAVYGSDGRPLDEQRCESACRPRGSVVA
jgi:hypothetical protein